VVAQAGFDLLLALDFTDFPDFCDFGPADPALEEPILLKLSSVSFYGFDSTAIFGAASGRDSSNSMASSASSTFSISCYFKFNILAL